MAKNIRKRPLLKGLISKRRFLQAAIGIVLYLAVTSWGLSLWWVLAAGAVTAVFFGKFFCRWMCPLGVMMELMVGAGDEDGKRRALYNYFKVGCPIAWIGGFFNRFSLFRVKIDRSLCRDCTVCDQNCYVAEMAPGHSLYLKDQVNPSTHFSCSRCLACVKSCPTGALTLGLSLGAAEKTAAPSTPSLTE